MSHFELFRCDGANGTVPYRVRCKSFLEIADTFPTVVLEKLLAADWLTIHTVGKGDRHYCPIHKAVAV